MNASEVKFVSDYVIDQKRRELFSEAIKEVTALIDNCAANGRKSCEIIVGQKYLSIIDDIDNHLCKDLGYYVAFRKSYDCNMAKRFEKSNPRVVLYITWN